MKFRAAAVLGLAALVPTRVRAAASPAEALQEAFVDVAAKAKLAVVNITVVEEQEVEVPHFFFGDPQDMFGNHSYTRRFRSQGTGSGFIVDPKGYIITNDHVVGDATEIKVKRTLPDGTDRTYDAKVIGHDPNLDLAVVKIQSKNSETFPVLKLASVSPRVGEWAIAIGSPFALEQTVTVGVISAQRQSLYIEGRRYPNMIQTDAAINQGNSGGPLLDLDGEVIGVNTAIYSPNGGSAGIGFAIPATEVQNAMGYLLAGKRFPRGWMGIELAPVDEVIQRRFALPTPEGALVNRVFADSPASKAGLQRGDVIRGFNGKPIANSEALISATATLGTGKKADLKVYRNGVPMDMTITLGQRPDWAAGSGRRPPQQSSSTEEEPQPQEEQASLTWQGVVFVQDRGGAAVAEISQDSPFSDGLQPGDVVQGINNAEVKDLNSLRAAVKNIKISDGVFLDILRRGQPLYLSIKP